MEIPADIVANILCLLQPSDLCNASRVCHLWNDLCNMEEISREIYGNFFGSQQNPKSWRNLLRDTYLEWKSLNSTKQRLMWCASSGNYRTLELTINTMGDWMTTTDNSSERLTALHLSASKNKLECVRVLCKSIKRLDGNQSIDILANYGRTPLHSAVFFGASVDCIKCLLAYGANIFAKEKMFGQTVLHIAAARNHLHLVEFFLGLRVFKVDVPDNDKFTPLHLSAMHGGLAVCKKFLEYGANGGNSNVTPLSLAAQYGYPQVAKILSEHDPM